MPPLPESVTAEAWFDRLVDYVARSGPSYRTDEDLPHAASDFFDGNAFERELRPLVRRRILTVIPVPAAERTLGNKVSWHLTPRGCAMVRERVSPLEEAARAAKSEGLVPFERWLDVLREDVYGMEYGYMAGEFTIRPEEWRACYDAGMTPSDAFLRRLDAFVTGNA